MRMLLVINFDLSLGHELFFGPLYSVAVAWRLLREVR